VHEIVHLEGLQAVVHMTKHYPLTLGMYCRKRKLGCENYKILVMRARLGVVAACFDAQTVGGGFESVAVVSQIRLASRHVGPIWQSMNDNL
jgi:hypothetical protein